jgi:hypothetical protein
MDLDVRRHSPAWNDNYDRELVRIVQEYAGNPHGAITVLAL